MTGSQSNGVAPASQEADPIQLDSSSSYSSFLDAHDAFLLDCDGVIWNGDEPIPGVVETLHHLRKIGKKLIFVTNNATKSRKDFKAKFDRLGIEAHMDEIFSSAYASVVYLTKVLNFPQNKKVYVVGESGIEDELRSEGVQICGGTAPEDNEFVDLMDFSGIKPDPDVGAVVCGFDMHMNYQKLARAFSHLYYNPDCHFILTNDDSTFPIHGKLFPGAGAISAPLRYALPDRKPIVIGKPNQPMLDTILAVHDLERPRTCMVGDRKDTDVLFGILGSTSTLAVLTGVLHQSDIDKEVALRHKNKNGKNGEDFIIPTYVIPSLGDLKEVVEEKEDEEGSRKKARTE